MIGEKAANLFYQHHGDQQVDQLTIKNTSDAGADIQPAGVDSRVAEHVREKHYEHIGDQYIYTSPYNSDYHEYIRFFVTIH